jgi:putative endonuclease
VVTQRHSNQEIGRWGERVAEEFLVRKGFRLVGRNVRMPSGEVDLIVENKDLIVFVEVKTRTQLGAGFPEESVTEYKGEHFMDAIEEYLETRPESEKDWRIDVIAITGNINSNVQPYIKWFEDAFS